MILKPACTREPLRHKVEFRKALASWFGSVGRDYPWRRTRDPYRVLVSEVMLQQTQIATVLGKDYYGRFLEQFPDLASLAEADDESLLKAWEGLGYYRRARMLRETARSILSKHDGIFPANAVELIALPGVGRYTAGAIRSFAFDEPSALVDGNVARVLSRLMDFSMPVDDASGQKMIWHWAEELADPRQPRIHNSAIMELGQRICRPGVPDCMACPVAEFCISRTPENLPIKRPKQSVTRIDEHAIWVRDDSGRLMMHLEGSKRREGLWKLPTRSDSEVAELPVLTEIRYSITRFRVTLRVHDGAGDAFLARTGLGENWIKIDEVRQLPMPSPFRRVIERLLDKT